MVDANGLESLVLRLGGLDEGVAEEDAAVNNALGTIENMVELQPSVRAAARRAPGRPCGSPRAALVSQRTCLARVRRSHDRARALERGGPPSAA